VIFLGWALILALSAMPACAADIPPRYYWDDWANAAKQICPSHNLDMLPDLYDELIGNFSKTLPHTLNAKATAIAAYSRRCADETAGFYCEMAVYVDAYKKPGLLTRFTTFACGKYKCLEVDYCVNPKTGKFPP
jgi:hypothetical protein